MQGELKIHFCSDTCFSMPAALDATYDANVAMDRLGLPIAPGKTLHGLLRDTWLTVRDTLDKTDVGFLLLGKPGSHAGEGLLRIGDARVDMATREWVQRARDRSEESRITVAALRDAFLLSRTMTSEDRLNGAPKQDTLRVVRMVPAGTVLIAPLTLKMPHRGPCGAALSSEEKVQKQQEAIDLLDLLARLTRHVGLDRNRGLGHVRMEVCWRTEVTDAALNTPPDSSAIRETEAPEGEAQTAPKALATNAKATVRFYPLRLTLTAPCLLADRALDPNSRATRSFVTGAALRGAIADALVRSGASEDELREILVSGTVRFLNAYPAQQYAAGKYRRSLPTPITWQRKKDVLLEDREAESQNLLSRVVDEETPEFDTQMTNLNASFFAESIGAYVPVEANRRFSTHQQRDRATGIATKGQATIFVYEALEADQTFLGAIVLPADRTDLEIRLQTVLAEPLWLGRSQRSGYGGAPLVALEEPNWNTGSETGQRASAISEGDPFQVRLTSDAILRDPITGQHDPWQLEAVLQKRFTDPQTGEPLATVETVCVAAGTAQGYNSLWRTALPALPCALAGSVALLTAKLDLSQEALTALQSQPIGERVAEGRGCFVIETEGITGNGRLTIQHSDNATQEAEAPQEESETLLNAQSVCISFICTERLVRAH
jgi:CRISPR-associated Csx10 family RAMP protein